MEHGSPKDRGSADSYYRRSRSPHCYKNNKRIEKLEMTEEEISEYYAGFEENESHRLYKEFE